MTFWSSGHFANTGLKVSKCISFTYNNASHRFLIVNVCNLDHTMVKVQVLAEIMCQNEKKLYYIPIEISPLASSQSKTQKSQKVFHILAAWKRH